MSRRIGCALFFTGALALATASAFADGVDEPIPSFYQEPGLAQNRSDVAQHSNERIDPFTGKLQWHFVDLYIPGNGGLDIKVQRSYSSLNEILGDDSPVGAGWTMHFGRVLRKASVDICALGQSATSNPVLELPDGSRQIMYDAPDGGSTITSARWKGTCAPSGGLIVQSPDGTSYEMTTPGPLVGSTPTTKQNTFYTTRITDRNGNTLDFTYTTMNGTAFGVQSIAASDGRTVTFTYTNGALTKVVGGGATWTYSLTPIPGIAGNQLNLDLVTRPDGTTWKYEYNAPGSGPGTGTPGGFSMKKVTYPTGGTINYTYGFVTFSANPSIPVSTVVSQKQTADGTWTYAYVPATTQIDFSNGVANFVIDPAAPNTQFDKTTGNAGIFNTTYTYDEAGNVMGIQDTLDPSYNRGLDYDPVDRLTTANGSWGNGTISYNGHGDITGQVLGTANSLTYAYDGQNRLATVSGSRNYTYGYDVYGNVTGNGVNSFTYNDASNMRCSNCGTGSEVDYDYDAGNMRVRSTPQGGAATYFVYGSSGNLLWELTPGVNLTEYIYLQGKQVATRQHTGG